MAQPDPNANMDSILNSVKKAMGIEFEDTSFDLELTFLINSVFGVCFQLGVGPKDAPYTITDASNTWDEFVQSDEIESIKTYVFVKVKLLFDPPTTSFVLESYKEIAKEFEWRCNVDSETH